MRLPSGRRPRPGRAPRSTRPAIERLERLQLLSTLTVTNTGDGGPGSLRQAITDANAATGPATIDFDIPGSGVQTIQPLSALPTVTNTVRLDGYSQPGATPNTLAFSDNAVILIQIDGSKFGPWDVLSLSGTSDVVRGLSVFGAEGYGITLNHATQALVVGNFVGLGADGSAIGNFSGGVHDIAGTDDTVGGTDPSARNVVSWNGVNVHEGGVFVDGASGDILQGNYLGTDVSGTIQYYNFYAAVNVSGVTGGLLIGGTAPGAGNVIAGSDDGVYVASSQGVTIQGNFIGTAAGGTQFFGADNRAGVYFDATVTQSVVGGTDPGAGNTIAFGSKAVVLGSGAGSYALTDSVLSNSIHDNAFGIDLGDNYVTPNTPGNATQNGHTVENYPVLTLADSNGTFTVVQGTFNGTPNTVNTLQVFAARQPNPTGHGEGQTLLATTTVTTDASGNATFKVTSTVPIQNGDAVSATATAPDGGTSEFAADVTVVLTSQALVAVDDSYLAVAGTPLTVSAAAGVQANDIDFENGGAYQSVAVSQPSHGSVTLNADGSFTYTPDSGYFGPDAFTYKDVRGAETLNVATVSLSVYSPLFTVTNTNDSGAGSLRQAILDLDAQLQPATIDFAIPGAGVHTIRPLSALPTITNTVTIDGYSQPGASPNTLAVGDNAVIRIQLDGALAGAVDGLTIQGANDVVRGLAVGGFGSSTVQYVGSGIALNGATGATIAGDFLGTDATGEAALPNAVAGVYDHNGSGDVIGGTAPADRNVVSGNLGVYPGGGVSVVLARGDVIQGNYIGTDAAGTRALPNGGYGVSLNSTGGSLLLGGTAPGAGNVISGNSGDGVYINNVRNAVIQGNLIGTDAAGTHALGNSGDGLDFLLSFLIQVGGTAPGAGNTIENNAGIGVAVGSRRLSQPASQVTILSNTIDNNGKLGIDLNSDGVTPNTPGNAGYGNVFIENYPVLSSAVSDGTATVVQGTLNAEPNTANTLQFFASPTADASGHGQGRILIATATVTTDADGNASFKVTGNVPVPGGYAVSATATDPFGSTSEFAADITAVATDQSLVALPDSYLVAANTTLTVPAATGVQANDIDFLNAGALTSTVVTNPAHGAVTLNGDGSFTYVPAANFVGTDTFSYQDAQGARTSNVALVTIDVAQNIFTVSNTNDGGAGSLRQALLDADAALPQDVRVVFAIPGAGVHTIQPLTPLPTVTRPMTIDGYTQPGSSANTLAVGDNAVLDVLIDGSLAPSGTSGLYLTGGGTTVRGLVIDHFSDTGIAVRDGQYDDQVHWAGGDVIAGNFVGTDASGALDAGNQTGVDLLFAVNETVGGTTPDARNVISGNTSTGLTVDQVVNPTVEGNYIGTDASGSRSVGGQADGFMDIATNMTVGGAAAGAGNLISGNTHDGVVIGNYGNLTLLGNFIGTDATGTAAVGNGTGVDITYATVAIVGGDATGDGNVISGNIGAGVAFDGNTSSGFSVVGNLIGTDVTGTKPLGNGGAGVDINGPSAEVGQSGGGGPNVIAYNGGAGVVIGHDVTQNVAYNDVVYGNSIHDNGGLGIDLGDDGVTPNRPQGTSGPNGLQPYPVLTSAVAGAGSTTISGTLAAAPNNTYQLQFYSNAAPDPSGHGEGQTFLGFGNVTTDANGDATFSVTLPVTVADGTSISATSTTYNGVSEFSADIVATSQEYDVTNTADSGAGSLRQAILDADAHGGLDHILFDITGGGTQTIKLLSALPAVSDPAFIDATKQPGYDGTPLVVLDGTSAGAGAAGLSLTASGSTVQGLAVENFNGPGISVASSNNTIGGVLAGQGDLVVNNGGAGVVVLSGTGNRINGDTIYGNGALGIDLGGDGVTPNTPGGPHSGPNDLQNYPVLSAAGTDGLRTNVRGTLNAAPNTTFRVEFFANPAADPSGHGQGQQPLGTLDVTTDASGNASFQFLTTASVPAGYAVSATATDPNGNTSEFAQDVAVAALAQDVTPQVTITRGGFRYVHSLHEFIQAVTITNNTHAAIAGPVSLVLDDLAGGALVGAAGTTSATYIAGSAYVNVVPAAGLASGQSVTVYLAFTDPGFLGITYDPRVLAGTNPR